MRKSSNSKIARYAKTSQALWYWIVLTAGCLSITLLSIPSDVVSLIYLRAAVGLSLVFLLPGYSVTRALFPAYPKTAVTNGLDRIERVALSVGLSIALVSIISLFLRYTPWSSDYQTSISLWLFTVVLSTVALVRESNNFGQNQGNKKV